MPWTETLTAFIFKFPLITLMRRVIVSTEVSMHTFKVGPFEYGLQDMEIMYMTIGIT